MLGVWYGIFIFLAPETTSKIESTMWFPGITEAVHWGKKTFDNVITDIPSIDEVVDGYESALSWARDVKNTITEWAETTKETIDSIRSWAQKAEETYKEAKETFENAKETLEDVGNQIQKINEVVESVNSRSLDQE